ncbi:single-stranded DNA-binding protein [Lysinibacillus sp. UGB7]|uniref:single-stranded DNA-binding protein n=1 Tax=Lysinibacillus sp. UGB7 TaxID=3411039 RepID=UPI003B7B6C11
MMNLVGIVGRLTKDPELKYAPSGVPYVRATVAVNRTFQNQQGEKEADFISVVAWRKQAENLANFMRKGSQVGVTGKIQTGSYEGQDGKRVYTTDVVADAIQFLDPPANGASQPQQQYGGGQPQQQYGGGQPQQQYGGGQPQQQYDGGQPQQQYGAGQPQQQYSAGQPQPQYSAGQPQPQYGAGQPQPQYSAGQPQQQFGGGQPQQQFGKGPIEVSEDDLPF